MNIISSFMNIILRIKEKLGFKLSEKEDLLILIDDANKVASMLLRMERLKEKMKMKIKADMHDQNTNIEHDENVKMSSESSKAKIKLDQSDDNIRLYIR